MPNIPKLIDALSEVYALATRGVKPPLAPINVQGVPPKTYCNVAVDMVATLMGCSLFHIDQSADVPPNRLTANEIYDLLASSAPSVFLNVTGEVAQQHANAGALVVAAWKNPAGEHGHVCIVRPGVMVSSGHWGKPAPRVMNIGKDVFIDLDAAYAFHEEPGFFAWVPSLPS